MGKANRRKWKTGGRSNVSDGQISLNAGYLSSGFQRQKRNRDFRDKTREKRQSLFPDLDSGLPVSLRSVDLIAG
jgi:hypothetical protein